MRDERESGGYIIGTSRHGHRPAGSTGGHANKELMLVNKKRDKAKRRNRSKSHSSTLDQHKKVGKKLLPPMLHMLPQGKLAFSSWVNNRLPELLWAALVISFMPRKEALKAFLEIAERLAVIVRTAQDDPVLDLTHSGLESFPAGIEEICVVLLASPNGRAALRPILMFESLPARDRWAHLLGEDLGDDDARHLVVAVTKCLDHQSQESTDIRWLILMFKIGSGRAHFPADMVKNLLRYVELTPEMEEMRHIRPSIRAAEMAFRMMSPDEGDVESDWCRSFWKESLDRSDCIPMNKASESASRVDEDSLHRDWFEKQAELVDRFLNLQTTTDLDARLDAAFGIALFSGNVLLEVLHGRNRNGISGRLLLRTLVECRITLAYLILKDDPEMWVRFRKFGVGQAKLALLKLDESADPPKFLSEESLAMIANEDSSEEFVEVSLGHWCDADLRKMADAAGVKADYDAFYGWSSAFVHGSWAAVRDASLTTCLNPLHRLHRIPRGVQREMESVLEDAVSLFNKICVDVDRVYPGSSKQLVVFSVLSDT